MNMRIYILECIVMCLIFGILVMGMLLINPLSFISDYPPEIQDTYYRSQNKEHTRADMTVIMKIKKTAALIFFLFVFVWLAHIAGAETFIQGVLYSYGYMIIVSAFDTFILDWIIFANCKRIRLPGTEDMDQEYHQKWFHVKVLLPMIPVFIAGGICIGIVMILIW